MKAFREKFGGEPSFYRMYSNRLWEEWTDRKEGWAAALKHFNKMYLDGVHPYDVIIEMQKELENE